MHCALIPERCRSLISPTSSPLNETVPEVGRSRRPITFRRVDFPEPDWPRISTNSPRLTSRSISERIRCVPRTTLTLRRDTDCSAGRVPGSLANKNCVSRVQVVLGGRGDGSFTVGDPSRRHRVTCPGYDLPSETVTWAVPCDREDSAVSGTTRELEEASDRLMTIRTSFPIQSPGTGSVVVTMTG